MHFVHLHAPDAIPAATDLCIVIQADRLLAAADVRESVSLPEFAALASWVGVFTFPMHVGVVDDRPVWLYALEKDDRPAPSGWRWHDTRALLQVFAPAQSHAISCARQLLWWERRHRFCGACGTPTIAVAEERARRCPKCEAMFFSVVSPAVIVAITRGDELLLGHNRNFRPGMFSLLAGFVEPGETLEQTVAREIREEVGIEVDDIRYITSQPWSFPNSLMVGFTARYVSGELVPDGEEIEQAGWFSRDALPDIPRHGTVARQLIDRWLGERRAAPSEPM